MLPMPRRHTPRSHRLVLLLALAGLIPAARAGAGTRELDTWLERIFAGEELEAKSFGPARWLDGGSAYTTLEDAPGQDGAREIVRYDAESGERQVLVPASRLVPPGAEKPLEIDDYAWSGDGSRLLVFADTKKVWRRNTRGDYWLLGKEGGELRRLGGSGPPSSLMFAKLSPDATRAAFVRDHDLWVEDLASGAITRLTSDGSDTVVSGTSDWVYEEEFDLRDGFRWSPDGREIAFWRFDSSGVGRFPLVNNTDSTYPVVTWIPYPKVGTANSAVKVGIVSASGGEPRWVELPGDSRDHYLPRMEWVKGTHELMLQRLNRLQNRNDVWLVEPATATPRPFFHDEDAAWLDVVDDWEWLPGGRELLWVSERDGWRQLWAASREDGSLRALTPGDYDILTVEGVDAASGHVYFTASPDDPTRRYLFRAPIGGGAPAERVTPKDQPGTHAYDVSPDGRFAFHTRSRRDVPPVTELIRLPSHERVRVLEDNHALALAVAPLLTTPVEFFRVAVEDGVRLDGWMVRPKDLEPGERHPLVMFVYGEPAGAQVRDVWDGARMLFHRALTTAGYVVACVDNRGTPAPRGREWRKAVYGSVGVLASKDQAQAVRALLSERPYLDPERVASWGWSGGGSMTLNLLFRSPDLYGVGVSVAPVPDQLLYDTIYQERYMGLPDQNAQGYHDGSPISFAEGLAGKLLLIHGTGDDNVHFQGSQRLINRLVELGKPFDFMEYPNRSHSISEGEGTKLHLHSLIARYLLEHLPPEARPR